MGKIRGNSNWPPSAFRVLAWAAPAVDSLAVGWLKRLGPQRRQPSPVLTVTNRKPTRTPPTEGRKREPVVAAIGPDSAPQDAASSGEAGPRAPHWAEDGGQRPHHPDSAAKPTASPPTVATEPAHPARQTTLPVKPEGRRRGAGRAFQHHRGWATSGGLGKRLHSRAGV